MNEIKKIEKDLIRKTLEWDNLKGRVQIKKGPFKGFAIYYNNWYIGCAMSLAEIHTILSMMENMVIATR